MAKTNYQYEKRQKDLAKKKKKEEKMQRRADLKKAEPVENQEQAPAPQEKEQGV